MKDSLSQCTFWIYCPRTRFCVPKPIRTGALVSSSHFFFTPNIARSNQSSFDLQSLKIELEAVRVTSFKIFAKTRTHLLWIEDKFMHKFVSDNKKARYMTIFLAERKARHWILVGVYRFTDHADWQRLTGKKSHSTSGLDIRLVKNRSWVWILLQMIGPFLLVVLWTDSPFFLTLCQRVVSSHAKTRFSQLWIASQVDWQRYNSAWLEVHWSGKAFRILENKYCQVSGLEFWDRPACLSCMIKTRGVYVLWSGRNISKRSVIAVPLRCDV